ncbi:hypothetical protein MTO96_025741 [Rhipicephalus appendiculatus]
MRGAVGKGRTCDGARVAAFSSVASAAEPGFELAHTSTCQSAGRSRSSQSTAHGQTGPLLNTQQPPLYHEESPGIGRAAYFTYACLFQPVIGLSAQRTVYETLQYVETTGLSQLDCLLHVE